LIRLSQPVIEDDEKQAVLEALGSGQLAQGPRVAAFERAFAEYVGTRHAVALNSGTAALHLTLLAHGIGAGAGVGAGGATPFSGAGLQPATSLDEVIIPAMSFAATANAVLHAGAVPVFVDIADADYGIDLAQVDAAVTPRTRAVIGVHLYGLPCDVETLASLCERRGITLIEDAAQSIGANVGRRRTGSFGTGCFSLYATKNFYTGEGGMITTDEDAVAERARVFRSQGERTRYVTEELGYNYRMMEMTAALGAAQLPKVDARNERRRANAARLTDLLRENRALRLPRELAGRTHVWHQYVLRVLAGRGARDVLQAALRERGIESAPFYPTAIHRQPLYARLGHADIELPVAQRLAEEALGIPVHPALTDADIDTIAAAVNDLT
jgi:dTDP-4-amino-4,6-dideoxygalactose transaminase